MDMLHQDDVLRLETPLIVAEGHAEIVGKLIEKGAKVDFQNVDSIPAALSPFIPNHLLLRFSRFPSRVQRS